MRQISRLCLSLELEGLRFRPSGHNSPVGAPGPVYMFAWGDWDEDSASSDCGGDRIVDGFACFVGFR